MPNASQFNPQHRKLCLLHKWINDIDAGKRAWPAAISRELSDAVLIAHLIHSIFPTLVDLHNYSHVCSTELKKCNWRFLNARVLVKLKCTISENMITSLAESEPGAIQEFLRRLRVEIYAYKMASGSKSRLIVPMKEEEKKSVELVRKKKMVFFGAEDEDDESPRSSLQARTAKGRQALREFQMKRRSEELSSKIRALRSMLRHKRRVASKIDNQMVELSHMIEKEQVDQQREMLGESKRRQHIHHSLQNIPDGDDKLFVSLDRHPSPGSL